MFGLFKKNKNAPDLSVKELQALIMEKATRANKILSEKYTDGNNNLAKSEQENSLHTSELIFSCVDYVAKAASQAIPRIYLKDSNNQKKKVNDKTLNTWIDTPNPFWCWGDLIEIIIQELLLSGTSYLTFEKNKGALESWALPSPSNMKIVPHPKNYIEGYIYQDKINYKPDEICLLRNPTLNNAYYGVPAIKPLIDTLTLEGSSINELISFYEDSTILNGILQSQSFISPEQSQALREQFSALYGKGGKNRRGVAVLPYKMEYKPIQTNPKDSMLLDSINVSAQRVMRVFKVNALALGGENTSTTHPRELMKVVFNTAVRPYLYRIQDQMTLFLRRIYKKQNLFFEFDFDRVVELDTSLDVKAASAKTLYTTGVASLNEARDLIGLQKIDAEAADKNVIASYLLGTDFTYIQDVNGTPTKPSNGNSGAGNNSPAGSTNPQGGTPDLTNNTGA